MLIMWTILRNPFTRATFSLVYSSGRLPATTWDAARASSGADGGVSTETWFQAAEAALDVPEFFESDVCGKAGLGHVVVEQLQADRSAIMEDWPTAILANVRHEQSRGCIQPCT